MPVAITAYALASVLVVARGRLSDLWGRRTTLYLGSPVSHSLRRSAFGAQFLDARHRARHQGVFVRCSRPPHSPRSHDLSGTQERAKAFSIYGAIADRRRDRATARGGAHPVGVGRWCLSSICSSPSSRSSGSRSSWTRVVRASHALRRAGHRARSGGLFFLVYGLGHAVTTSWSNVFTWASLVLARGAHLVRTLAATLESPVIALRILLQRTRGGSLISLFITSIGMFGVSLFLAYYLQVTLGFSPLRTGLAFLPLVGSLALSAFVASARLLAKTGPRRSFRWAWCSA